MKVPKLRVLTVPAAWGLAGVTIGCVVVALTVAMNDSIRTFADALVLAAWLAVIYGGMLAAIGAGLHVLGTRVQALRDGWRGTTFSGHAMGCYLFFLACALGHWIAESLPGQSMSVHAAVMIAALFVAFFVGLLWPRAVLRGGLAGQVSRAVPLLLIALTIAPLWPMYAITTKRPCPAATPPERVLSGSTRKVILFGIDGAEWNMIDPLIAAGRLPHLQRLRAQGVSAPLKTSIPTYSPIIWTTIATGVDESVHGVHDFTELYIPGLSHGVQRFFKDPVLLPRHVGLHELAFALAWTRWSGIIPITSTHRRVKALWNMLSDAGMRVAVVNWFATWPVETVNGFMISDRNRAVFRDGDYQPISGGAGLVFPPGFKEKLEAAVAADRISIPSPESYFAADSERQAADRQNTVPPGAIALFSDVYYADYFAASAAAEILRNDPVQFLAVYVSGIDVCSHLFMRRFPALVPRYYEFLDAAVGRLMDVADSTTTFVIVSDHGWGFREGEVFSHFHGPDGVLIISGDGLRAGTHLATKPSTFDIAPTVLALLGLPKSKEMAGSPIREALTPEAFATAAAAGVISYGSYHAPDLASVSRDRRSVAQDERTVERLRMLGYMQ